MAEPRESRESQAGGFAETPGTAQPRSLDFNSHAVAVFIPGRRLKIISLLQSQSRYVYLEHGDPN